MSWTILFMNNINSILIYLRLLFGFTSYTSIEGNSPNSVEVSQRVIAQLINKFAVSICFVTQITYMYLYLTHYWYLYESRKRVSRIDTCGNILVHVICSEVYVLSCSTCKALIYAYALFISHIHHSHLHKWFSSHPTRALVTLTTPTCCTRT